LLLKLKKKLIQIIDAKNMEDNKQTIYHKSDWGKQVIYIVIVLAFLFFSYKKNPTKELFTKELTREYAIKNGLNASSSIILSEFTNSMLGGIVEPLVKRNDFILFSTYELELNNQYIKGKIGAVGFWDNIIFYDVNKVIATKKTNTYYNAGLVKYLTDNYGDKGFGDDTKFIIEKKLDIIKVTSKQDGITKKFKTVGNSYQLLLETYTYNEIGLVKYLTDTYGDRGFADRTKFDIVKSTDGTIKVTGMQDGITKKFKYIGNTYQQQ
jgi:hypothetical protein